MAETFKQLVFNGSIISHKINLKKGGLWLGNGEKESTFAAANKEKSSSTITGYKK